MLMFSQDLLHHHYHETGENKHQECPVCVLSITSAISAVLNESFTADEPQSSNGEVIIKSNTAIHGNYFPHCFPDRAPPAL